MLTTSKTHAKQFVTVAAKLKNAETSTTLQNTKTVGWPLHNSTAAQSIKNVPPFFLFATQSAIFSLVSKSSKTLAKTSFCLLQSTKFTPWAVKRKQNRFFFSVSSRLSLLHLRNSTLNNTFRKLHFYLPTLFAYCGVSAGCCWLLLHHFARPSSFGSAVIAVHSHSRPREHGKELGKHDWIHSPFTRILAFARLVTFL